MPRRKSDNNLNNADSKSQTDTQSHSEVLKTVLEMFDDWWKYTQPLHSKWHNYHKLYNNERVLKFYEGVTDTFVPMTFSTIETMVAAICSGELNINYLPQDIYKYLKESSKPLEPFASTEEETNFYINAINKKLQGGVIEDENLEVLNSLFDYQWEAGDFDARFENFVRSGLKIGNSAIWLSWNVDRPKIINVAFKDYIFDPTARDDESCGYVGRRYLSSVKKLEKEMILNPDTQEMEPRYKNLDQVPEIGSIDDKTLSKSDKEQMLMGSTLGSKKGQTEVIEIVTEDRQYTVANRTIVIEDRPNIFKAQAKLLGIEMEGILPSVSWSNYKDEDLLIGKSEIATFDKEQERLNDLANQKSDSITRSLIQNTRIDPKYKALAPFLSVPGSVIPAEAGAVERLPQAQVPYQVFNEETSIKNNIREVTATDQIVKGVGSSADVTATEAKLTVAQAGQRIEMKVKSLERGPLKRLARIIYQMNRLFITDPMLIPSTTNRGMKPVLYNPSNYTMDFEPKVSLAIFAKQSQRAEKQEAMESFKIVIQDPTNNIQEAKEILYPKMIDLDKDEVKRIITPANAPIDPMAAPMQPAGVMA